MRDRRPWERLKLVLGCVVLAAVACRDVALPPPPGGATITGHATYAIPGRSDRVPAANASVTVLGTGLLATTNPGGAFTLPWGTATSGRLLVRLDHGPDTLQRLVDLSRYGVGGHQQVDLGELVLGENASVQGRVLRTDIFTTGGHAGSTVFLPSGPFAAATADDGSFLLTDLPPGPLALVAFRGGYASRALAPIELQPGQQVVLGAVLLTPEVSVPAEVTGTVAFLPAAPSVGNALVELRAAGQPARSTAPDVDLRFRFQGVPAGLYQVVVSRSAYSSLQVPNVLIPSGSVDLGTLLLTEEPADAGADAGWDAGADAGWDAGWDAGLDAGVDAGPACTQGSCTPCAASSGCPATEWCDRGQCSPQCTQTAACTLGRLCDAATGTCVVPCSGGSCAAGSACDATVPPGPVCRTQCDGTFPCSPGLKCDGRGLCVPECLTAADCHGFSVCHAGQCQPSSGCADDQQCPVDQVCFAGACRQRPTSRVDGGAFACAEPCQCRLGEWCHQGLCEAEALPTAYLAAGGTGAGLGPGSPSGDLQAAISDAGTNARLALRAGDTFTSPTGYAIGIGHDHFALRGGYLVCSPTRWVRGDATRTTLASDAGQQVRIDANTDVELSNLTILGDSWPAAVCEGPVVASSVAGLKLSSIDLTMDDAASPCTRELAAVYARSSIVTINDLTAKLTMGVAPAAVVRLYQCQADVQRVSLLPPSQRLPSVTLVAAELSGPSTFSGLVLPTLDSASVYGVAIGPCAPGASVTISGNSLAWPRGTTTTSGFAGIMAVTCGDVTVRDNTIDGSGPSGVWGSGPGVLLRQSAGRVERNVVRLPLATNGNNPGYTAGTHTGIVADQLVGSVRMSDNVILGGASPVGLVGLQVAANHLGGAVTVERNTVDIGPANQAQAFVASYVGPVSAMAVRDNFLRATAASSCTGSPYAYGVSAPYSTGVLERNRIYASGGAEARAFTTILADGDRVELYANHLWSGPATCSGGVSAGASLSSNGGAQVWLGENTIEAQGAPGTAQTIGVTCTGVAVTARGNVIGGGLGLSRLTLGGYGNGCFATANLESNLFWLGGGTFFPQDFAASLSAGPGWPASNVLQLSSPYDAVQPPPADGGWLPPSRLAADSVAIDHGLWPVRGDGTVVTLDLAGAPRDAGLGPDMGCCERQ